MIYKAEEPVPLTLAAPEVISVEEPLAIAVTVPDGVRAGLHAALEPSGEGEQVRLLTVQDGTARTTYADLTPGAYALTIRGATLGSPVAPVSKVVLVWDPTTT